MPRFGLLALATAIFVLPACDQIQALIGGGDSPELVADARSSLQSGDFPTAASKYDELASSNPESVYVAVDHAYVQLLAGNYEGADATLAAAEAKAGEGDDGKLGEIKLRRALIALRTGDFDKIKEHGSASGTAEGKLLAAEVHLVDLEGDQAVALLKEIQGTPGVVGETAMTYLQMLESSDQIQAGLAEATALWALGDRESACEAAEELVKALDREDKNAQLLLWAGRAVTSGQPAVATSLLDDIDFPPPGQAWRVEATKAMVLIAEGDHKKGIAKFKALAEGGAPADGMADALATAAALTDDKETVKELARNVESAASARSLMEAGAFRMAQAKAPEGSPMKSYLESQ